MLSHLFAFQDLESHLSEPVTVDIVECFLKRAICMKESGLRCGKALGVAQWEWTDPSMLLDEFIFLRAMTPEFTEFDRSRFGLKKVRFFNSGETG